MPTLSSSSDPDYFEPELYNAPELDFLLKHLGESPEVATFKGLPDLVSRAAVDEVLGRVYRFQELEKAHGKDQVSWPGVDAVKACIVEDIAWRDQCAAIRRKGGPKHPSLFHWNSSGEGIPRATGADGGTVRTRILPGGKRKRLGIRMTALNPDINLDTSFVADFSTPVTEPDVLVHDEEKRRFECPICAHTETYKPDNRRSMNAASMRMAKHLKDSRNDERTRHDRLWQSTFSSARTAPVADMQVSS